MADETTGKLPDLRLAPGEAILGEVAGLSIQVYDQLRSKEWGGLSALHLTTRRLVVIVETSGFPGWPSRLIAHQVLAFRERSPRSYKNRRGDNYTATVWLPGGLQLEITLHDSWTTPDSPAWQAISKLLEDALLYLGSGAQDGVTEAAIAEARRGN